MIYTRYKNIPNFVEDKNFRYICQRLARKKRMEKTGLLLVEPKQELWVPHDGIWSFRRARSSEFFFIQHHNSFILPVIHHYFFV